MVYFRETYNFLRFQRGSNYFQGLRGRVGVQMLISIETHITCGFPGGSGPPIPPQDPCTIWLTQKLKEEQLLYE